jgi:hypothetical protein
VNSILDPLKEKKTNAWTKNTLEWLEKIKLIKSGLNGQDMPPEEKSRMREKITHLKHLIEETGGLLYPPLKSYEVTDGMYDQLGYGVHVSLHAPYITKINGAQQDDKVNCKVVDYVHRPSGIVRFPEDMRSYLLVNEDVSKGDFLCIQYNDKQTTEDGHTYFESNQAHTIKAQASENHLIVDLIETFLSGFNEYLPKGIVDYLDYCVKFARVKESVEIVKTIKFIKSINFDV